MKGTILQNYFKGKNVLVTGSCGTVGAELIRQLLQDFQVGELTCMDNNESELFFQEQRFSGHAHSRFVLADMRDAGKLSRMFRGVDIVFHAAAFKHVILCERSPFEAVQTNILGVRNVIEAACENAVGKVIFTSSDKAVNPTNVMGTSKLMGERLMSAANVNFRGKEPIFASTRFGNVLGSRGSVIPIFREQIKKGAPVTLTDPDMTRFIMSIKEAVRLVIESAFLARGGEVFVTKMPVIRIEDLVHVMIEELAPHYGHDPGDIQIQIIGTKAGEKLYEELMSEEETRRTLELERYFAVLPAFQDFYHKVDYEYPGIVSRTVSRAYNSANEDVLTQKELRAFLHSNDLLAGESEERFEPDERYWGDEKN